MGWAEAWNAGFASAMLGPLRTDAPNPSLCPRPPLAGWGYPETHAARIPH